MGKMDIPELEVDITRNMPVNHEENISSEPKLQARLQHAVSDMLEEKSEDKKGTEILNERTEDKKTEDLMEDSFSDDKAKDFDGEIGNVMHLLETITQSINQLKQQLQSVESANRQLAEETRRSLNSVIQVDDRLHAENQKLKDDMYSQMLKPVLMGLCQVANNISKDIKKETNEKIREKLLDIRDDVVGVCMSNLGVEVYEPEVGEDFDELRHRLVKSIVTENENEHRKIQEVLGQGYLWRKNSEMIVLEPCKVNVYNLNHNKSGV